MKGKRNLSLVIACVLAVCLILLSCVACNKKKDEQAKQRAQAVQNVGSAFLSGIDGKWQWDMQDDAVARVANPGDYVVTRSWTGLICDVIGNSSLQTGKINALAARAFFDGRKNFAVRFFRKCGTSHPPSQTGRLHCRATSQISPTTFFVLSLTGARIRFRI